MSEAERGERRPNQDKDSFTSLMHQAVERVAQVVDDATFEEVLAMPDLVSGLASAVQSVLTVRVQAEYRQEVLRQWQVADFLRRIVRSGSASFRGPRAAVFRVAAGTTGPDELAYIEDLISRVTRRLQQGTGLPERRYL